MDIALERRVQLVEQGLYSNPRNLKHFLQYMFGGNDPHGRHVLDIGGGVGVLSLAACEMGAASADCVDPETAGATAGTTHGFEHRAKALGLVNARMHRQTFQEFEAPAGHYDLVFMYNSVNHLDEQACIELQTSEQARQAYRAIFDKLRGTMRRGGRAIVADCGRSNLFNDLGLKSPVMPTIEWHKHQNPEVWIETMKPSGFRPIASQWSSFNSMGRPGRVLGNRFAAYLLLSHFRIEMEAV